MLHHLIPSVYVTPLSSSGLVCIQTAQPCGARLLQVPSPSSKCIRLALGCLIMGAYSQHAQCLSLCRQALSSLIANARVPRLPGTVLSQLLEQVDILRRLEHQSC